jgi:hypothetical protein
MPSGVKAEGIVTTGEGEPCVRLADGAARDVAAAFAVPPSPSIVNQDRS